MGAYLDGELGVHRRRGLEEHVAACAACAAELEAQRRVLTAAAGALVEIPAPPGFLI